MRVARETWLLLAIGLADLVSTAYLVRHGLIREANPVMAWYLVHFGMWAFCAAKTTMLVCPLMILEWVRRVEPHLGVWALRIALLGYIVLYLSVVWQINEARFNRLTSRYLPTRIRSDQHTAVPPLVCKPMTMPVE